MKETARDQFMSGNVNLTTSISIHLEIYLSWGCSVVWYVIWEEDAMGHQEAEALGGINLIRV